MTLYLHETHRVRGALEDEFESHFRDEWMARLGEDGDARLLWYLNQAHGTGPSYRTTTITAVRDGAAWERLAMRVAEGDLRSWARRLDELRHDGIGKILRTVAWSPTSDIDLESVPSEPGEPHELSLYMEDTGWPHVPVDDYTSFWERVYLPLLNGQGRARPKLLEIQAVFQPVHGAGRRPEAILMQKIVSHEGLLALFLTETPPEMKAPGTFMYEALQMRDQWESRLLRTSSWSPYW